jgi:hypothetical protein
MLQDREVISRLPPFAKLCDNASDVASFCGEIHRRDFRVRQRIGSEGLDGRDANVALP